MTKEYAMKECQGKITCRLVRRIDRRIKPTFNESVTRCCGLREKLGENVYIHIQSGIKGRRSPGVVKLSSTYRLSAWRDTVNLVLRLWLRS